MYLFAEAFAESPRGLLLLRVSYIPSFSHQRLVVVPHTTHSRIYRSFVRASRPPASNYSRRAFFLFPLLLLYTLSIFAESSELADDDVSYIFARERATWIIEEDTERLDILTWILDIQKEDTPRKKSTPGYIRLLYPEKETERKASAASAAAVEQIAWKGQIVAIVILFDSVKWNERV